MSITGQVGAWVVGFVLLAVTSAGSQERDFTIPRVPPDQIEQARKLKNPVEPSKEIESKGKELYTLACVACHGMEGKGDGPLTKKTPIEPSPRNFANPEFQSLRTDGELFWVLNHGIHETEMMRMDFFFTDDELWALIHYLRGFNPQSP